MSCQGHFKKDLQGSILYYRELAFSEEGNKPVGFKSVVGWDKFINPMVALKFSDEGTTALFVRTWRRLRVEFYQRGYLLLVITPKNFDYVDGKECIYSDTLVIHRFKGVYVSVSFILANGKYLRYHQNKIRANRYVKRRRKVLFDAVIKVLDYTCESLAPKR